jgi:hypothetical protein
MKTEPHTRKYQAVIHPQTSPRHYTPATRHVDAPPVHRMAITPRHLGAQTNQELGHAG